MPGPATATATATASPSPLVTIAYNQDSMLLKHQASSPLLRGTRREDRYLAQVAGRMEFLRALAVGYVDLDGWRLVAERVRDLIEFIWAGNTTRHQVPQLLALLQYVRNPQREALEDPPFCPEDTIMLMEMFDVAFASLVSGVHVESGLPMVSWTTSVKRDVTSTKQVAQIRAAVENAKVTVLDKSDRWVGWHEMYGQVEQGRRLATLTARLFRRMDSREGRQVLGEIRETERVLRNKDNVLADETPALARNWNGRSLFANHGKENY